MTGWRFLTRATRLTAAAVVLGGMVIGCGTGSGTTGSVCAAYLRYNDAIAEAGDVTDLRDAVAELRKSLPAPGAGSGGGSDQPLVEAAAAIDAALASNSTDPQTYLTAAAGAQTACRFDDAAP